MWIKIFNKVIVEIYFIKKAKVISKSNSDSSRKRDENGLMVTTQ